MKRSEFRSEFLARLTPLYDERETAAMLRWYVQDRLGIAYHLFVLSPDMEMPDTIPYLSDLQKLTDGMPLQHVTGFTEFHALRFDTDARALIPRPETEELVSTILEDWNGRQNVRILDIGTGSGIIAVTLAKKMQSAIVEATDISGDALTLAQQNAGLNNVDVNFWQSDILKIDKLPCEYDVIVSNPPYIPESTKKSLHKNVTEFEPALALFVPDGNPLIFYDKIARLAFTALSPKGKLYFETYEEFHKETYDLLKDIGFVEIECCNDFYGRPRFVIAQHP